jgi:uncharacterized protein YndB with AHSA1/START domain
MGTNTIRLHELLRATPWRVYRAFLDPDALVKWIPPDGFTGKVHHLGPRSAAPTGCRSPTSRPAAVTRSVASTASWWQTSAEIPDQ